MNSPLYIVGEVQMKRSRSVELQFTVNIQTGNVGERLFGTRDLLALAGEPVYV